MSYTSNQQKVQQQFPLLMQRYSLYIDHQLVSQMIRQLENIVKICSQQLDQQYQTYELRSSIYQEFVFQINSIYHTKYKAKMENMEIKDQQRNFYELTAKLNGLEDQLKLEDNKLLNEFLKPKNSKKGRPSKNQQAQANFSQWIKQKIQNQGKLKFQKKQLDKIYPIFFSDQKKTIPVGSYLRILKRYQLFDVVILTRGGKQKSAKDLIEKNQLIKKEEQEDLVKDQYNYNSQLDSTSQMQSNFYSDENAVEESYFGPSPNKRTLRSQMLRNEPISKKQSKRLKIQSKSKIEVDTQKFDFNSDLNENMTPWQDLMRITHGQSDEEKYHQADIYQNSRSFQ